MQNRVGMTRRTLLSLLVILLGTSAARADCKAGAVHRATQDLHYFAWALGILTEGKWDPGRSLSGQATCVAAVERAREHGLDDSEVLRDPSFEHAPNGRRSGNYHYEITLGEAPALCSAYGAAAGPFLHQTEAGEALKPFDSTLLWMENVAPGQGGGDVGKRLEKAAAECPTALDKVLAAGARLDAKVVIRDVEKTLEKAHKDICDALAAKVPAYMAKHRNRARGARAGHGAVRGGRHRGREARAR